MKQSHKARRRAQWMADLESFILQLDSRLAGRIPWNDAIFHFHAGNSPGLAALKIAQSNQPKDTLQ